MDRDWVENEPIYRQLRDMVVAMIIDGRLSEGDALPSVRQVAADYRVNPLTVLRSFQQLVDEDYVEKRRGVGMFVKKGARRAALRDEREKFLHEEWPRILKLLDRLGLTVEELLHEKRGHKRPKLEKGG
jgi:GntR family transcriptional regulator